VCTFGRRWAFIDGKYDVASRASSVVGGVIRALVNRRVCRGVIRRDDDDDDDGGAFVRRRADRRR
jgi:hypothetical protein